MPRFEKISQHFEEGLPVDKASEASGSEEEETEAAAGRKKGSVLIARMNEQ